MAQVTVTIAGRTYRMACGDGEEAHLEGLAALYDSRIEEMRRGLGELGDMRLHVMAALMIADELTFLKKRVEALEAEAEAALSRINISEPTRPVLEPVCRPLPEKKK